MLKILEIKLYAFSEEEFNKGVKKNREKFYSMCKNQNRTEEQTMCLFSQSYALKNLYENYCIGYLEILFDGVCLCYDSKIMLKEKPSHSLKERESFETIENEEENTYKQAQIYGYSLTRYKPRLFSEKKRYMSNYHIDGKYSPVHGLTNSEIVKLIKKDISLIQTYDLFEDVYFDLSNFENVINYIDFVNMFEEYKQKQYITQ